MFVMAKAGALGFYMRYNAGFTSGRPYEVAVLLGMLGRIILMVIACL